MQRVYGVAFKAPKRTKAAPEHARRRPVKAGSPQNQPGTDLFVLATWLGRGLPLFTPRGTVLKNELDRFVQDLRQEASFEQVSIPHLTKTQICMKRAATGASLRTSYSA